MPITQLTNMSVPLEGGNQVLLMPKLKYRFRVTLLGFGVEGSSVELTKQVQDVTRPKVSFEEVTVDVYTSKVYLAGKPSFEQLTLTLRDDASGFVQRLVGQQIQKQFDFLEQASARSGVDYKFTVRIEILDGGNATLTPTALETTECYGCIVISADYGDLGYDKNELATVALSIRFDNMVQFKGGTVGTVEGIGAAVGRNVVNTANLGGTTTG